MSKKLLYMVVDTETATLPFVNEIANNDAETKKKIAIAKPLVYDIGWTIVDRAGTIHAKKNFLITETFAVPSIFNTAYYAEKRPIYIEMLKKNEISVLPWNVVMEIFIEDMNKVDAVGAFNSMFDFKKAIPFTELYIRHLYSENYYQWENIQKNICERIAGNAMEEKKEKDFESDVFKFRENEYVLFDLWGLAVKHLLNNTNYKNACIKNNLFTASGTFFKTSAESSYQYLINKYDFVESHTALDDAIIESFILSKIAKKHAITAGIEYFPFKALGYTDDYCKRRKTPNINECETVYNAIAKYVDAKMQLEEISNYTKGLIKKLQDLAEYAGFDSTY